jgi:hypothetical protein
MIAFLLAAAALASGEAEWFQKTTQALVDAIATGDKAVWDAALAEDFIVTTEDGEVQDRAKFLQELQPLPPGFSGTITVRDLTVKDLGGAAVVHYLLDETETIFGQVLHTKYLETDTWRREGKGWKAVASQVTVVPRDLEPVAVDKHLWPSLAGDYALSPQMPRRFRVFFRDGSLYGGPDEKSAALLIPLSPLVFHQKGTIHLLIFVQDEKGEVTEVRELHKYNEVIMRRAPGGASAGGR